jgi:nuclear-control-of-ATPase protein 2
LVESEIPKLEARLAPTLQTFSRPGFLTRYWIAALCLPPLYVYLKNAAVENREWFIAQLRDAKATLRGWVVGWVVEPLEDVAKTLRSGGEGLGVDPTTVNSDKEVSGSTRSGTNTRLT